MPRQEKNRGRTKQFPRDLESTLNDILAWLRWQEQLVRYAIGQVEQRGQRPAKKARGAGRGSKGIPRK